MELIRYKADTNNYPKYRYHGVRSLNVRISIDMRCATRVLRDHVIALVPIGFSTVIVPPLKHVLVSSTYEVPCVRWA
jgi:hypothetical protein